MNCPPFEELLALRAFADPATAIPGDGRTEAARRHLDQGCERCRRRLALAEGLASVVGTRPLASAADALVRRALSIPAALERAGSRLEVLAANLAAEPGLAPSGLRGEGAAGPHWLYRAEDWELDVAVLEPGVLAGQVLARNPARSEELLQDGVCVLHSDDGVLQTPLETTGEFLFEGLRPLRYSLLVDVNELAISVPEIDLTAESGAL